MLLKEASYYFGVMGCVVVHNDRFVLQYNILVQLREKCQDIFSIGGARDLVEYSISQVSDGSNDCNIRAPLFRKRIGHRQPAVSCLPYSLRNSPDIGASFIHIDDFLA